VESDVIREWCYATQPNRLTTSLSTGFTDGVVPSEWYPCVVIPVQVRSDWSIIRNDYFKTQAGLIWDKFGKLEMKWKIGGVEYNAQDGSEAIWYIQAGVDFTVATRLRSTFLPSTKPGCTNVSLKDQ
jgi:hypothetical protein